MNIAVQDTLFDLPEAVEDSVPVSPIERFRLFSETCDREGGLVPQSILPDVLCVSKARVSQFIGEGRFVTRMLFGQRFVTGDSLASFVQEERKNGRPFKSPSTVALMKISLKFGKEVVSGG